MAAEWSTVTGVCRQPPARTDGSPEILPLDITDTKATEQVILHRRPDVIIHAAAANPGNDEDTMWAVNCEATKSIAEAAGKLDTRLIFVSTDIVHNGRNAPYNDSATASPINAYGKSKAAGEDAVLTLCRRAAVTRTSLIYGLQKMDRGTAGFVQAMKSGQPLNLFTDVMRQPVWIDSLCSAICHLAFVETDETGIVNVAGDQRISRADFAMKMLEFWGETDNSDNITLTSGAAIDGLPLDCTMRFDRASALGIDLPGVDAVLATLSSAAHHSG